MKRVPNMSGKNFITVCKWICGGWAFCSCTFLMGQVAARQLPGGKGVGRAAVPDIHHMIKQPTGTPVGAGRALRNRMNQAYGKLPLSFEPNHGQANRQVRFLSRGEGYTLFLTESEAVLTLKKSEVRSQKPEEKLTVDSQQLTVAKRRTERKSQGNPDSVLRMRLLNANPGVKVTGLDEMQSKTNYFIGKDPKNWRTNVPNYAKVKYEGVYPGVDLVYYGNQRHLEYDFVLAPGAEPKIIRMSLGGEKSEIRNQKSEAIPRINSNGDLIIMTNGGEVRLHKPVVYQEKQLIVDSSELKVKDENRKSKIETRDFLDGRYILTANNQIGFEVAAYDHSKPLV